MLKWKRGRPAVGKEQSAVEAQKLIRIESVNRKQKPSRLRRLLSCFGAKYDLTQFPKFDQDDNHNAKGKSRSVRSSRRRRKEVDLESKSSETAPESAMSNAKQVQQLDAFTELKVAKCDVLPPVQKNDEESLGTGAAGDGEMSSGGKFLTDCKSPSSCCSDLSLTAIDENLPLIDDFDGNYVDESMTGGISTIDTDKTFDTMKFAGYEGIEAKTNLDALAEKIEPESDAALKNESCEQIELPSDVFEDSELCVFSTPLAINSSSSSGNSASGGSYEFDTDGKQEREEESINEDQEPSEILKTTGSPSTRRGSLPAAKSDMAINERPAIHEQDAVFIGVLRPATSSMSLPVCDDQGPTDDEGVGMDDWPYNDTFAVLLAADANLDSASLLDLSDGEFYCDEIATEEFGAMITKRSMNAVKVTENDQQAVAERIGVADLIIPARLDESFETIKSCSEESLIN